MKETRQKYTTYELEEDFSIEKDRRFSMSLGVCIESGFDNKDALGKRMAFILVREGSGTITIDNRCIPYLAPCVFCINEKEHIVIKEDKKNDVAVILFHPMIVNSLLDFDNIRLSGDGMPTTFNQDRALLATFIQDRSKYTTCLALGSFTYKRISSIVSGIMWQIEKQDNANWPCKCRSYVMELLFMLETLYESDGFGEEIQPSVIKEDFSPILSYIYLHYNEKISVEELTDYFHVSRTTMAKMFRDNVGDSFVNYTNKLRIHMASVMLRDTDLPVQEIMYRVGFSDSVHFLRMFKRYIGVAPTVYREQNL